MSEPIKGFTGEYRWLSNFGPGEVEYEGLRYPTREHAYQAAKSDLAWERLALSCTPGNYKSTTGQGKPKPVMTAKEAKIYGKTVSLRHNWDLIKRPVMKEIVRYAFTHHEDLKAKLLATGDRYLEETNWWGDTYWGRVNNVGHNHLGHIIMEIRSELQRM